MRRARIAYEGVFYHAMNHGVNRDDIFAGSKGKTILLDVMAGTARNLKIKILAYFIMAAHYHRILENISGSMSVKELFSSKQDFLGFMELNSMEEL
jgi:REP element-mobilizing transposase RayT